MAHSQDVCAKKLKDQLNRHSDLTNHWNAEAEKVSMRISNHLMNMSRSLKGTDVEKKMLDDAIQADFDWLIMGADKKIILGDQSMTWIDAYMSHVKQEIENWQAEESNGAEKLLNADEENGDSVELICYCRKPRSGRVIKCANVQCPFKCFHYKCLKAPKNECWWYCSKCRKLVCLCNKRIVKGPIISCSNLQCSTQLYHVSCMGLENKLTLQWYCGKCHVTES